MRRNLLASTALTTSTTLITGAALAANLPLKAPPAPAPIPFSWTGCYVGLNAGGASTSIDHGLALAFEDGARSQAFSSSGRESSFTGGGQLGCNWQFDPKWVLGLVGDFDWLKATRSHTFAFNSSNLSGASDEDTVAPLGTSLRWLGTVRTSFGYAWERSLLYATGGLAFGRVTSSASVNFDVGDTSNGAILSGSYGATRTGWVAGLGYVYAFTDRLSGKLEYLHFDLGTASYNLNLISGDVHFSTVTATTKVGGDIVRVGLDYKFSP
jgi:outer membrane immunogenic protein